MILIMIFRSSGKAQGGSSVNVLPQPRASEASRAPLSFSAQCRLELAQSSAKSRAIGPSTRKCVLRQSSTPHPRESLACKVNGKALSLQAYAASDKKRLRLSA